MKYLGETFDLHCGGVDLIFPHHENEIAQSEAGTGKPFVRHWVHVKHLMVDNETMSKSKGNFFTIPDLLERGHSAEAIRYLLVELPLPQAAELHVRGAARPRRAALERIRRALESLRGRRRKDRRARRPGARPTPWKRAKREFDDALSDDLNTPEALAAVHGLVNDAFHQVAEGVLTREGARLLLRYVRRRWTPSSASSCPEAARIG